MTPRNMEICVFLLFNEEKATNSDANLNRRNSDATINGELMSPYWARINGECEEKGINHFRYTATITLTRMLKLHLILEIDGKDFEHFAYISNNKLIVGGKYHIGTSDLRLLQPKIYESYVYFPATGSYIIPPKLKEAAIDGLHFGD